MRILVLGSGGREHVMAWKLADSSRAAAVFVAPGNGGTRTNASLDPMDFAAVKGFCRDERIDLVVVGPEAPLAAGIVDSFHGSGIPVFGPSEAGARLEGSKIYAKQFMQRHGVATAESWSFTGSMDPNPVVAALNGDLVVKYDGLAAGKGVIVCASPEEAHKAIADLKASFGSEAPFLIERRLRGRELSVIGVTDGTTIRLLQPSQDHKPAYDGNEGPNTGGMGAYAPVPFCDDATMETVSERVVLPTLRGLIREGISYRGVIYFGLMLTAEGPQLLEYNVRLGDPEAEVILPGLESDFLELVMACFRGNLEDVPVTFMPGYHVDVVVVSGGYPDHYERGFEIKGLENLPPDILVFHAGTRRDGTRLVTSGGRVLNVVAHGGTLAEARDRAYAGVAGIGFEGARWRRDIGVQGLS